MPASPTSQEGDGAVRIALFTPPIPRLAPDGVFDAFGWCASDVLEWRRRAWDPDTEVTGDNPPGMAFVLHAPCDFLPTELARLHVSGMGPDEWALAPYGIDDATDELYARRQRPRDLLWLAADHLGALAWGLHDWAHFHNHGPFTERAWTELQCDASALAWLWRNREAVAIDVARWERARLAFVGLSRTRFRDEGRAVDAEALLAAPRIRNLAEV